MPRFISIHWDLEDDPEGNVQHIAEHGISQDEVEDVLQDLGNRVEPSRSSGHPLVKGRTRTGRHIAVVFLRLDPVSAYPLTAFELDD